VQAALAANIWDSYDGAVKSSSSAKGTTNNGATGVGAGVDWICVELDEGKMLIHTISTTSSSSSPSADVTSTESAAAGDTAAAETEEVLLLCLVSTKKDAPTGLLLAKASALAALLQKELGGLSLV